MEYLWIEWVQGCSEKYPIIMPYGWRVSQEYCTSVKDAGEQARQMVWEYNKYLHKIANIS